MREEDLDLDLVELEDDEGGTIQLKVERYFYYNGDEYVLLSDDLDGTKGDEAGRYVMKVHPLPEEGEDMEEFLPVEDEALMDRLIQAASTVLDPADEEE